LILCVGSTLNEFSSESRIFSATQTTQLQSFVTPQVHGIHPPKKLVFFSLKLERLIEKVWRKGPFFRKKEEKRRKEKSFEFQEEKKAFNSETKVDRKNGAPGFETYEPTNTIYLRSLGLEWRKWQRVNAYFREVSEHQEPRENRFNAKIEALISGRT